MKVVLLQDYGKLGKVGDIAEVAPGFAKNFLLRNEIADYATEERIAHFNEKRKEIEKENAKKKQEAEQNVKKIEGKFFFLERQAGEDSRLYGAIKTNNIAEAVSAELGKKLDRKAVVLNNQIKELGVHKASIVLFGDVQANIFINVARNELEAKAHEEDFKSGKSKKNRDVEENSQAEASANIDGSSEKELEKEAS